MVSVLPKADLEVPKRIGLGLEQQWGRPTKLLRAQSTRTERITLSP